VASVRLLERSPTGNGGSTTQGQNKARQTSWAPSRRLSDGPGCWFGEARYGQSARMPGSLRQPRTGGGSGSVRAQAARPLALEACLPVTSASSQRAFQPEGPCRWRLSRTQRLGSPPFATRTRARTPMARGKLPEDQRMPSVPAWWVPEIPDGVCLYTRARARACVGGGGSPLANRRRSCCHVRDRRAVTRTSLRPFNSTVRSCVGPSRAMPNLRSPVAMAC
jgi:hypothetical protein